MATGDRNNLKDAWAMLWTLRPLTAASFDFERRKVIVYKEAALAVVPCSNSSNTISTGLAVVQSKYFGDVN